MVEGGGAYDQVEAVIGEIEALRAAEGELQAFIVGGASGHIDHGPSGIDADELACLRVAKSQGSEQVTGTTPDVEDPMRGGYERRRKGSGAISNLMVESSEPTLVISGCSLLEGLDVTAGWHNKKSARSRGARV
jgi:hypothetical protein